MNAFAPLFKFEQQIADFYGAPYGVAVDCCTHAMELCLRLKQYSKIQVPYHTYVSVPMMLKKLGIKWSWKNECWMYYYFLTDDIIDGAVYFKEGGYITGTKLCLSFHIKKPINIGRGGMILLDNKEDRDRLIKMRYDGRSIYDGVLNKDEDITEIGYHYYMTPETAAVGSQIFDKIDKTQVPQIGMKDYRNLLDFKIFR